MRLVPSSAPPSHVISDLSASDFVSEAPAESKFVLKKSGFFSGNGRALFCGLILGAALLCAIGHFFNDRQRATGGEPLSLKRFVRTHTHVVSASAQALVTPPPIVVNVDARLLHVSAIALGHPRIAVINGQSVTEGDYVKVRSANPAVIVSLRVVKIADRRIDLTDGRQQFIAHLEIPGLEQARSN